MDGQTVVLTFEKEFAEELLSVIKAIDDYDVKYDFLTANEYETLDNLSMVLEEKLKF